MNIPVDSSTSLTRSAMRRRNRALHRAKFGKPNDPKAQSKKKVPRTRSLSPTTLGTNALWEAAASGQFGPEAVDNFVENIHSGEKIWMRKAGGSYVMDVDFVESGFRGLASR